MYFLASHTLQSLVKGVLLVSHNAEVMLQRVAHLIFPLFERLEDSRLNTAFSIGGVLFHAEALPPQLSLLLCVDLPFLQQPSWQQSSPQDNTLQPHS